MQCDAELFLSLLFWVVNYHLSNKSLILWQFELLLCKFRKTCLITLLFLLGNQMKGKPMKSRMGSLDRKIKDLSS